MRWFTNLFDPLPAKDPNDWSLTKSSTPWAYHKFCEICDAEVGHEEYMTSICNRCGGYGKLYRRSYRKIFNGEKWVWQYKFRNKSKVSETCLHY